jgi:hypothetical protein
MKVDKYFFDSQVAHPYTINKHSLTVGVKFEGLTIDLDNGAAGNAGKKIDFFTCEFHNCRFIGSANDVTFNSCGFIETEKPKENNVIGLHTNYGN